MIGDLIRPAEISKALAAWQELLGREYIVTEPGQLSAYARDATAADGYRPEGVLRPATLDQVIDCVKIARRYHAPLYPVSKGYNLGYGSMSPNGPGQTLLLLDRMNAICEINAEPGYAILEPGVTQEQLSSHLAEHHPQLFVDITGGHPESSFIGNIVERGLGHSKYGDRYQHSCAYEVVLGSGEVITTGFGTEAAGQIKYLTKNGIGPALDGIFTQSNFGIVTKICIWLQRKQAASCAYLLKMKSSENLEQIIQELARLREMGVISGNLHLGNDMRILSARGRYPWDRTGGKTPLPQKIRTELRQASDLTPWVGLGLLEGSSKMVSASKYEISCHLKKYSQVIFLTEKKLHLAHMLFQQLTKFGTGHKLFEQIVSARYVFELLSGRPSLEPQRALYWRKKEAGSLDPLANNVGVYWISPILPLLGKDIIHLEEIVENKTKEHALEPFITIIASDPRSARGIISLFYDRDVEEQRRNAQNCYNALTQSFRDEGWELYRTGITGYEKIEYEEPYKRVLQAIKSALDPDNIIAPGRYGIEVKTG